MSRIEKIVKKYKDMAAFNASMKITNELGASIYWSSVNRCFCEEAGFGGTAFDRFFPSDWYDGNNDMKSDYICKSGKNMFETFQKEAFREIAEQRLGMSADKATALFYKK